MRSIPFYDPAATPSTWCERMSFALLSRLHQFQKAQAKDRSEHRKKRPPFL